MQKLIARKLNFVFEIDGIRMYNERNYSPNVL